MGACKAPNFQMFVPCNQNDEPSTTIKISSPLISRRLLLSSSGLLPLCCAVTKGSAAIYDPVTQAEREASAAVSKRVSEAVELLEKGRELQAVGDFNKALQYFTLV